MSGLCALLALGSAEAILESAGTEAAPSRDERMKWWREARFGMFIHWGLYAVPAGEWKGKKVPGIGEWIMNNAKIPISEYERLAEQFNPVKFNADEWVRIAKNAGMKYIVITSKHHDGFCLWDSKVSDYDIMDATPFERDILKELSEACKRQDVRLCFYHSIMDWHHPDAQGPFHPKYNDGSRSNPNFARYVEDYMKPQIKELITNYGPLGVLWFDGEWIKDWTEPQGRKLYDYVRSLQPDIIVNNRVSKGRKGMKGLTEEGYFSGDFGTPEQEIPATGLPGVDWETCMTMNDTWGFKSYDNNWKSTEDLLRKLVDIASKGDNFLLNVGPTAEGLIPQPSVERLAAIGEWMAKNSESIYGTTASPFESLRWGRCTTKPGRLYLHVFNWPQNGELEVPVLGRRAKRAYLLAQKGRGDLLLGMDDVGNLVITVPRKIPDRIDTVIAVEIEGQGSIVPRPAEQAKEGSVTLRAAEAIIHGHTARYESGGGKDNIGYWTDPGDYVTWGFKVTAPGTFDVKVTYACANGVGGTEYTVAVAEQQLGGTVSETGDWAAFVTQKLGRVKIGKAGTYTLSIKPKTMPGSAVMNLKSVALMPVEK
jgi:alpha-L-fucosidase